MDEVEKSEDYSNRDFVLEQVKKDGKLLDLASEELKDDREIVFEAVKDTH